MKAFALIPRRLQKFERDLISADKARKYAARIATRVEVNRLRLKLKKEIRQGAPGGQTFAPLSKFARLARPNRKPLARLAIPVRYWERQTSTGQIYSVGFRGGSVMGLNGSASKNNQLSRSWVRLATMHQEGGQMSLGEFNRNRSFDAMSLRTKYMLRIGGLGNRRKNQTYKRLGLRSSTTKITIPARDIVDPFWAAHRGEVFQNIRSNFQRKMRGKRI